MALDLSPARWIWLPSQRTLANSFVLFRKDLDLPERPVRATGWVIADSRYRLTVNGERVQWGPAPADPRWPEADPLDLSALLRPGYNVLGVEVLFYGHGEGTWPMGKPGLLMRLDMEFADGRKEQVVTDDSWLCLLDRAHRPGQYRRWFLRALQEEFDARLHPQGWDTLEYKVNAPQAGRLCHQSHQCHQWRPAMVLAGRADKPSMCTGYDDYLGGSGIPTSHRRDACATTPDAELRERSIPLMRETDVPTLRLSDSGLVVWKRDPDDWFEFRMPDAFEAVPQALAVPIGEGAWHLPAPPQNMGVYATFEFPEQIVGWPHFTIEAPEGTVVELMAQEAHDPVKTPWLDTHFYAWSRFICREGANRFEAFEFESLRWLQLHIHRQACPEQRRRDACATDGVITKPVRGCGVHELRNQQACATDGVIIQAVGVRRRVFPWPNDARVSCGEPALQRLFDASVNTLNNCAQETCVDGMGRERQQYSGDVGHQLHALRYAFGERRLPARFLATFSQGLTLDGYFLDCWPAYDRLARVMQRQVGATPWGPLLDHGVGFAFDCWNHYWETGGLEAVREPYPRLLRFADYLRGLVRSEDGLLPVEGIGVPAVWIDHDAYRAQRHKQCAFNLYAAAMLQHALAPLARAFGDGRRATQLAALGKRLQAAAVRRFWSTERGLFVANLPWLAEKHPHPALSPGEREEHPHPALSPGEREEHPHPALSPGEREEHPHPALSPGEREEAAVRLCDRSLATSILFDQCPGGSADAALRALADCPPEMGLSYPANAGWRLWALAKGGRIAAVLRDLRERWATMRSVVENNTLQECWKAEPDGGDQWSHCPVAPLYVLFMSIAGIRPTAPGFARCEIRPQLGDLRGLELAAHTPLGPIAFAAESVEGGHELRLAVPEGVKAVLVAPGPTGALRRTPLTPGESQHMVAEPRG